MERKIQLERKTIETKEDIRVSANLGYPKAKEYLSKLK